MCETRNKNETTADFCWYESCLVASYMKKLGMLTEIIVQEMQETRSHRNPDETHFMHLTSTHIVSPEEILQQETAHITSRIGQKSF